MLRNVIVSMAALGLLTAASLVACGSSKKGFDPNATGSGGPGSSGSSGGEGGTFDTSHDASATPRPNAVGWLHGKVVAPEGTIPISSALVYLTNDPPETIPPGAYCDTCVHLTALQPYAYSKADGTFDLGAYTTGKQYLVVQKGQFRRVRQLDVTTGDQPVQATFTRLPGKTDAPAGDTIPKIALVLGGFDHIEVSMNKLGIQDFYRYGDPPPPLPSSGPGIKTGKSGMDLMQSAAELAGYHITLMPCAAMGYQQTDQGNVCGTPTDGEKKALDTYVQSGGKLYVTDYSYEAVRQTWPGFITWYDYVMNPLTKTSDGLGTACRAGAEDTPGKAEDPGLSSWMKAIGENDIELKASWSRIASVHAQPGVDPDGKPVTITPKVWMTSDIGGQILPATVSFEQKCGRVLFSSYHCEGDSASGLLAQEKALLYVLLEVGVCVGQLPPPPPPR